MDIQLKKINFKVWGKKFLLYWFRFARSFFVALFFLSLCAGVYIWYSSVYRGAWSEEEKKAYAAETFEETVFREQSFLSALEYARGQHALHSEPIAVDRDVFKPSE